MSDDKPVIPYWRVWTGDDGISRQALNTLSDFEMKAIGPADPQWQGRKTTARMSTLVMVLPVGWVGDWHENPKPQWIIPLSGRWFVETMDGVRTEMGAGEISFGGDQNCREVEGKRGHRSGTVGDVPAVLMVVQLEDRPAPPPGGFG